MSCIRECKDCYDVDGAPYSDKCFLKAIKDLKARVRELEAERNNATQTKVCHWKLEDDDIALWQGECGEEWCFHEGGPKENNMNFCPHCGGIAIVEE